ncbi:hypothetical protein IscW_ISCW019429 [Ixodes scapularis]|uniref:Uncharacterized protein n=1 Tax=Ixodes scapularis TaxID=6945 RepID=B7PTV8_IXOSC|nr:hypothetical protein IscW_ISCW019429 [Ixodes scapularis]
MGGSRQQQRPSRRPLFEKAAPTKSRRLEGPPIAKAREVLWKRGTARLEPGASACPSLTPWHRKWVAAAGAAAPAFFRRRFPTPVADIHPAKGTRPRWLHAPRRPAPLGWVALKAGDRRSPRRRPLPPARGSGRV